MPELGRTQYFFGAVVLILNPTLLLVGLCNVIYEVIGCLNAPESKIKKTGIQICESCLCTHESRAY